MRFVAAVSQEESTSAAAMKVIAAARQGLGDKIDLAFLFFTPHHAAEAGALAERIWLELDPTCVIGCVGTGVCVNEGGQNGSDTEIDYRPGVALLAGNLPGVRLQPFRIRTNQWQQVLGSGQAFAERVGGTGQTRGIIGIGDSKIPARQLADRMKSSLPNVPLVNGIAGVDERDEKPELQLIYNDQAISDGWVGVRLCGPIELQTAMQRSDHGSAALLFRRCGVGAPSGTPMAGFHAGRSVVEAVLPDVALLRPAPPAR